MGTESVCYSKIDYHTVAKKMSAFSLHHTELGRHTQFLSIGRTACAIVLGQRAGKDLALQNKKTSHSCTKGDD